MTRPPRALVSMRTVVEIRKLQQSAAQAELGVRDAERRLAAETLAGSQAAQGRRERE